MILYIAYVNSNLNYLVLAFVISCATVLRCCCFVICTQYIWVESLVLRIGKTGYLKIQTDKQEDDNVEGTSQGTFTVLGLHPATAVFYVGGAPTGVMVGGLEYVKKR